MASRLGCSPALDRSATPQRGRQRGPFSRPALDVQRAPHAVVCSMHALVLPEVYSGSGASGSSPYSEKHVLWFYIAQARSFRVSHIDPGGAENVCPGTGTLITLPPVSYITVLLMFT